jgi:hypothetical protein
MTAREGCFCPKKLWLEKPAPGTHAFRSAAGVAADVRANDEPVNLPTTKPAELRLFYAGANTVCL